MCNLKISFSLSETGRNGNQYNIIKYSDEIGKYVTLQFNHLGQKLTKFCMPSARSCEILARFFSTKFYQNTTVIIRSSLILIRNNLKFKGLTDVVSFIKRAQTIMSILRIF